MAMREQQVQTALEQQGSAFAAGDLDAERELAREYEQSFE